ncbi:4954_t:CDS:2 [Paraglomus brasilianum]|uniref:4954_t:CDS:1 n=1 Tax=Paraglomus brasilianum TaxID=144538 RepID=A0A9N9G8G0_9GLOM|nr:4954_t:CDS:2 [Paraglomus brasilianum]
MSDPWSISSAETVETVEIIDEFTVTPIHESNQAVAATFGFRDDSDSDSDRPRMYHILSSSSASDVSISAEEMEDLTPNNDNSANDELHALTSAWFYKENDLSADTQNSGDEHEPMETDNGRKTNDGIF